MVILLFILLLVSLYGIRVSSFHKDYISLDSTNAIKGLFAVLILYSHMRQYLILTDTFANNWYLAILNYIGQMMVTMYLFYSGYGLMESQRKKPDYQKDFPKRRLLKILLHFDIAVILYIVLQLIIGNHYSISEYAGSLIGWTSVGNSNWFIFVILALYVIFYFSLCFWEKGAKGFFKKYERENMRLMTVFVLCVFLWLILYFAQEGSRWINNIMAFPLGICYSMYRRKVEEQLNKGMCYYIVFLILTLSLFAWRSLIGIDKFGVCTCIFALWTVLLSMKVKFNNKMLQWLGTLAFPIFILQRLPMIALTEMGVNQNVWLFVMIVIPLVLVISHLYNWLLNKLDKEILKI